MSATAIYASRILTPQEELRDCVIVVEAGRITGIGHRDEVHIPPGAKDYVASGMTVVPGFVDVHIHGAGGHDVMEAEAAALDKITATVARFGTTSIVATTVTAPIEATCHSLEGIAAYIRAHESTADNARFGADILGIHLEGPFINPERRGVHPTASILAPSVESFEKFRAAAGNLIKLITIAPEMPGALKLIAAAVADGVVVGLGHTDADYAQARAAIQAGARHAVHVYNAMRPFTHRDPGVPCSLTPTSLRKLSPMECTSRARRFRSCSAPKVSTPCCWSATVPQRRACATAHSNWAVLRCRYEMAWFVTPRENSREAR